MSDDDARAQSTAVMRALLGSDPRLYRLYDDSPEFHMGLRVIGDVLPRFVDLMADDAEATLARRAEMIRRIETEPPAPLVIPPPETLP